MCGRVAFGVGVSTLRDHFAQCEKQVGDHRGVRALVYSQPGSGMGAMKKAQAVSGTQSSQSGLNGLGDIYEFLAPCRSDTDYLDWQSSGNRSGAAIHLASAPFSSLTVPLKDRL